MHTNVFSFSRVESKHFRLTVANDSSAVQTLLDFLLPKNCVLLSYHANIFPVSAGAGTSIWHAAFVRARVSGVLQTNQGIGSGWLRRSATATRDTGSIRDYFFPDLNMILVNNFENTLRIEGYNASGVEPTLSVSFTYGIYGVDK
jgi:hypothetical protein